MWVSEAAAQMRSRADLDIAGMSTRAITTAVRTGHLRRIDRGWYLDMEQWRGLRSEQRHLLRVVAAHRRRPDASRCVFALWSAAVLHQLPLARATPSRVHVAGATASGHVDTGDPVVARHDVAVADSDITSIDGIRCTTLERTVADVLRCAPEETGIALLDAALRRVAWDAPSWNYDESAAALFLEQVRKRLPVGGRGVRRARFVLQRGDGRAQLPGESISRLYLLRLGFAPPRLQVPIPGPHGNRYFVDFGLDDADAWGEFDGRAKYLDAGLRGAHEDVEHVVLAEKQREDWIRGTTNRKFGRWGSEHITSEATLARRLAAFHIHAR